MRTAQRKESAVSSSDAVEAIVRDAFEDVALLIGGAAALHRLEDGVVQTLVRRLDRVRARALSRLTRAGGGAAGEPAPEWPHRLHPAVEGFLQRSRCGHAAAEKEVTRA
jgi:hypothetical protein